MWRRMLVACMWIGIAMAVKPGKSVLKPKDVEIGKNKILKTVVPESKKVSQTHKSVFTSPEHIFVKEHSGGPDGFGYTFIDSDDPNGPAFNWIDASNGTSYALGDDDHVTIELPFTFPFYNQILTQINLVSNGFLTSSSTTDFSNDSLPDDTKNNIIAPFWDDLSPNNGGSIYTLYDSTNNVFVIEWYQVPHYGSGGPYTFEVILYPNGDLKFQYLEMVERLNSSTIGIQGGDGSDGYYLQYTYNGNPLEPHDSLAIYWQFPSYSHDVAVVSITSPVAGETYNLGDTITPQVSVTNNGNSQETFDVIAEIYLNSNLVYTSTQSVTVDSGELANVTFDTYTIDTCGFYQFVVYTNLTGDENPQNDTAECNFLVISFVEDFESTNGGYMPDPSTGAWEWGTPSSGPTNAHSGSNLWGTVLSGNYEDDADWYLYTVDFIATSDNPVFTFWHWYDIETGFDGGNVSISTDGGATWSIIEPDGGYPNNSISGLDGEPGYTGHFGEWTQAVFILNGISSGTVFKIRFHFGSDGSINYPGWYIDDVGGTGFEPYLPDHDVGALRILAPSGPVLPESEIVPMGTVRNFGANTETFDVVMTIDSAGKSIVYADTQTVTLDPLSETVLLFDPWVVHGEAGDIFNITMRTYLTGDENPNNDEASTVSWIVSVIEIPTTSMPPTLDGVIGSDEWANALVVDVGDTLGMSPPAQPAGVNTMYIMNDSAYLYMAFDITTDTVLTDYDQIGIYLDDNGDGDWASDGSEGNNNILPKSDIGWASRVITPGPTFGDWVYPRTDRSDCFAISSASGHVTYEIRIPFGTETQPDPAFLGANQGDIFGMWLMYAEETSDEHHIWWPQELDSTQWANPEFYGKLKLGITTNIGDSPTPLPLEYKLLGSAPNPVKLSSKIMFAVPQKELVRLELYNSAGRLVKILTNKVYNPGVYSVNLDASRLVNGVYFVRMRSGKFRSVKKLIVAK